MLCCAVLFVLISATDVSGGGGRWRKLHAKHRGGSSEESVQYDAGPPTAALAEPNTCVFDSSWAAVPLQKREWIAHDVAVLTFGLADPNKPLGLSTCACILARGGGGKAGSDAVVRPYTPISTNALRGAFQLMVKVYPDGVLSQHLATLPLGSSVEFKHIAVNVKIQYPFHAKRIVMLVGGTGITPMLQALHAVLGTEADRTKVTLLYSNKGQQDILARETLQQWEATFPRRLHVHHTLTREPAGSGWAGGRGRIDKALLAAHLPLPSDDCLIFVCGPQSMYESLSGPRGDKAVGGVLAEMGYSAAQVIKF